jgi:hypothetical protein
VYKRPSGFTCGPVIETARGWSVRLVSSLEGDVASIAVTTDDLGAPDGGDPKYRSPRTATGIGIGSSEAELLAAYPDIRLTPEDSLRAAVDPERYRTTHSKSAVCRSPSAPRGERSI